MNPPKIDKRSREEIVEELRAYTPYYVPEFDISESRGAGIALVTVFANMLKLLIDRLNKVSEKNFIAFLDLLGAQLLPPLPSKAPITFTLAEGTKEHVSIPARTQIAAGDVVFETKKNILASPAKFVKVYCIARSTDTIFESPPQVLTPEPEVPFHTTLLYTANKGADTIFVRGAEGLEENDVVSLGEREYGIVATSSGNKIKCRHRLEGDHHAEERVEKVTTFELFEGKNQQEHILYLGHGDWFNIKSEATIQINIADSQSASQLGDSGIVQWEYWGEAVRKEDTKEIKEIDWHPLDIGPSKAEKSQVFQLLRKKFAGEIKEYEIHGIKSRWIRCKSTDIAKTKDLELDIILIGGGAQPSQFFKFPPKAIRGVGKTFGKRLSDKGVKTVEDLLKFKNRVEELAKILSGKEKSSKYYGRAENILENAQKRTLDKEYENMVSGVVVTQGLLPDLAFFNDVPLEFSKCTEKNPIYPFGKIPRLYDTFYIASQEAFSKKGATITFTIEVFMDSDGDPSPNPLLSWEYWDGKGWVRLSDISCSRNNFSCSEHLGFDDYQDQNLSAIFIIKVEDFPALELTKVNGQENFWIRVRLVGGHYGQEVYISSDVTSGGVQYGKVTPPQIRSLSIDYEYGEKGENLAHCLTYNNLEFTDVTEECKTQHKVFKPFLPLDDQNQTLYLGFDNKLEKGPISLFFSIKEQPWSSDKIPRLEWEYYSTRRKWVRLDVLDDTRGLTRTGTVEFAFPQDCQMTEKFGAELFWIRAVDVDESFKPIKSIYAQQIAAGTWERKQCDEAVSARTACTELLEVFQPGWQHPDAVKEEILSPRIAGIFLNTTWAVQAETVEDELVGSSDGTGGQRFSLAKTPVISESVWVNELGSILEEERKALLENAGVGTREERDEEGKVTEFWVKWQPVVDLLASAKDARHYELDRVSGKLKFGDGIQGKVPPIGTDNIVASYCSGGGSKGNMDAFVIKDLKSSIPFADKVFNPLAAPGGTGVETIPETLERAPYVLKHRNRAVTAEDFEQLALQASRDVAKAKCLPHFDNHGLFTPGWVTVLLIPESSEERPKLSLQLRRQVEEYLRERSANTVIEENHLQVAEPVFVDASVSTTLMATAIDRIPEVEREALRTLRAFLHPLTGGYEGKGWDFGRLLCLSDFYALLEGIEGVDYVKSITIELRTSADDTLLSTARLSSDSSVIEMPPYAILCSGEHTIAVNYEPPRRGG